MNILFAAIYIITQLTFPQLTIKTPERRQWRRSGNFMVNLKHFTLFSSISTVDFEQVSVSWVMTVSMYQPNYLLIIKTDFSAPPQLSQKTVHN